MTPTATREPASSATPAPKFVARPGGGLIIPDGAELGADSGFVALVAEHVRLTGELRAASREVRESTARRGSVGRAAQAAYGQAVREGRETSLDALTRHDDEHRRLVARRDGLTAGLAALETDLLAYSRTHRAALLAEQDAAIAAAGADVGTAVSEVRSALERQDDARRLRRWLETGGAGKVTTGWTLTLDALARPGERPIRVGAALEAIAARLRAVGAVGTVETSETPDPE